MILGTVLFVLGTVLFVIDRNLYNKDRVVVTRRQGLVIINDINFHNIKLSEGLCVLL